MDRLTYFKVSSPYPNDFTKHCSLNGIEIDNNFLTLEGRDIKSLSVEGNYLVITLYNGTKLKGEISSLYDGYTAGEGIDQELFDNDKIIQTNASLIKTTEVIRVEGESEGKYNPGDEIPSGTSVQEILQKILFSVIDVESVLPTSRLLLVINGHPPAEIYEVGTVLKPCWLEAIWTDGKYVGKEGYEYTLQAQCNPERIHYFLNGGEITTYYNGTEYVSGSPTEHYAPIQNYVFDESENRLKEGTYTFSCITDYGEGGQPSKSDGTCSDVIIPAGSTERSSITFKSAYKFFYGYIPKKCWAFDITNHSIDKCYVNIFNTQEDLETLNSGFCTINGITEIDVMQSTEQKSSLVLVVPEKYKDIIWTENSFHTPVNVNEKWVEQLDENGNPKRITYTVGGITTTYYVYILHSLLPIRYNNIQFTHMEG